MPRHHNTSSADERKPSKHAIRSLEHPSSPSQSRLERVSATGVKEEKDGNGERTTLVSRPKKQKRADEPPSKRAKQSSPSSAKPQGWSEAERLELWRFMMEHVDKVNWSEATDRVNQASPIERSSSAVQQHWPTLKKKMEGMLAPSLAGQRSRSSSSSPRKRKQIQCEASSVAEDDGSEEDSDSS